MQKNSLESFEKDIDNIREYIEHIDLVNKVEQNNREEIDDESITKFIQHFREFSREKKRFEHRAVIISLYGILENHINLWVQEHINNIPLILKDDSLLSSKFIASNFKLSIELISIILKQKNNPKYENIDKENILKKLNSVNFELNSEAFISASGNLTHQKIVELFAPLEIDAKKINKNPIINSKKSTIDTLISLRNEISHGTKIDNIITEFSEYIDSLEEYGKALFSILEEKEEIYKIIYEIKYDFYKIEKIHKVINNSILLFEIRNNTLSVGDYIIVSVNGDLFKNKILSIELDNKKIEKVETDDMQNIGVELESNFNIKKNQTFYIKKRECNS
jgi:hypothetical protein